jgi:parallel beta-helix repeat protein
MVNILKKLFAISIAYVLLTGAITIIMPTEFESASGSIVYVGGSGTGNYTSIQGAVNNANPGDTVYVFTGVYKENLILNKKINLMGENKYATIIDAQNSGTAVTIQSNWVNVTGFTITNCSGNGIYILNRAIIRIENNIINNVVNQGVELNNNCNNITISNNDIDSCKYGVLLSFQNKDNKVLVNKISNTQIGVYFWNTNIRNSIIGNTISASTLSGIYLWTSNTNNKVYHNSLVNNVLPGWDDSTNSWDSGYPGGGNFYDEYNGTDHFQGQNQNIPGNDGIGDISISITGGSNVDNYPLWPNWNTLEVYTPAPGSEEVTEYAMGSVKVGVIFVESNGTIDSETENWSVARMSIAKSEIQDGLNWWAGQEPNASLTFSMVDLGIKNTSYEPIQNIHTNESMWVNEIMADLGYSTGTFLERVKGYSNQLRSSYNTDWAFTILVVDSDNDTDSFPGCYSDATFANQWCAWAYMEYGYFTMTYDNDGWGVTRMNNVTAHETGHMFYATDEYTIPGERSGYLNALESGAVAGHLMFDNTLNLSTGSIEQIGWRDTDSDGILDILDTIPNTYLDPATGGTSFDETPYIQGAAVVVPLNNDNPSGEKNAITLNILTNVQYRINNGTWINTTPLDGTFDEPVEYYFIKLGKLANGQYFVETRAWNSVGNYDTTYANFTLNIINGYDTIYVDDDFTDNPALHQWDTITKGITDANPGDTVYVYSGGYNLTVVVNKTINLTGENAVETLIDVESANLAMWVDSPFANITEFTISNSSGYCVNITAADVSLKDCTLVNNSDYGINAVSSQNLSLIDCSVIDNTGYGIYIRSSENSQITNTVINVSGASSRGIIISDSNNSIVTNCKINATGSNAIGFYLDSEVLTIYDSAINSTTGTDIYIMGDGNMTIINSTFSDVDVEQDGGGVLQVYNYLTIQAYYEDGLTPIVGADVQINDNNGQVYTTPGYGGIDSTTGASGRLGPFLMADRWYIRDNTPLMNPIAVRVKKTIDRTWEEVRLNVNLSTSHTEYFMALDITKPLPPDWIIITRIGKSNSVNITWNQTLATTNYTVFHSFGGCAFFQIADVPHPNNWTIETGLPDGMIHLFKIRSRDAVGLVSNDSAIKDFNLTDITRPLVPYNLSAKPVLGADKIELTWDLNDDDTEKYELWWSESITGPWTFMRNVSHPNNSTNWSHSILVNNSQYHFKIRAWDEVPWNSSFSVPVTTTHFDYKKPVQPINLRAETTSQSNITLTWSASSDADVLKYRVFLNRSGFGNGGPYELQATLNALTYDFIGLMENTTYYFVVQAVDEANNPSEYSNQAWNITFSVPPEVPILDELPEYTNKLRINITGTSELFTTVIIFKNGIEAESKIVDAEGKFSIELILEEGMNSIKARARDLASVSSDASEVQTVILDTQKPVAAAGEDLNILTNEKVVFNASESYDNYGIVNYTWRFIEYGGDKIVRGEKVVEYTFEYSGYYEVVLEVKDEAGNVGTDSVWIDVTAPILERPIIKSINPENNSINVDLDDVITLTFSISMNTNSVASELIFSPEVQFGLTWSESDTVVVIEFLELLNYNTEYKLTIGKAVGKNDGILEGAPRMFKFTTKREPEKPVITITSHSEGDTVKVGENVTISGRITGVPQGTAVKVSLGSEEVGTTTASDGTWSVAIEAPNSAGDWDIFVQAGDETYSKTIEVVKPDEPEKDGDDEDKGILGFGPMFDYLLIIIIIIIIIVLSAVLRKKPKKPEEEEEDGKEDEELMEEPDEEVGEEGIVESATETELDPEAEPELPVEEPPGEIPGPEEELVEEPVEETEPEAEIEEEPITDEEVSEEEFGEAEEPVAEEEPITEDEEPIEESLEDEPEPEEVP